MKKRLFALMLAMMLLFTATALAAPRADTVFYTASASLSSGKSATFRAQTRAYTNTISVVSVSLYVKTGDTWTYARSLPAPTTSSSGINFNASKDYSAYIGSGTYRINATFNADGYTIARSSGEVTF